MQTFGFINTLQERLGQELPGYRSHVKMLPEERRSAIKPDLLSGLTPRPSSVLILLFPDDHFLSTILIQRTLDRTVHSGQISFPGGRCEPEDRNAVDTALREAWEEVGVSPEQVKVLGELSSLYVSPSNFEIVPVIGFTENLPQLKPNKDEVAGIIQLPLKELGRSKKITDLTVHTYNLKDVPYFGLNGHVVWGATAMILQELLDVIEEIN